MTVVSPRSTVTRLVAPRKVTAITVPTSGPESDAESRRQRDRFRPHQRYHLAVGHIRSTSGSVQPRTVTSPPLTSPASRLDRPTNSATNDVAGRE